jgi:FAD/FMN-containing dehydrogenase
MHAIHAVGPDWVDVDAGMLWSDLVPVLAGRGMQFRGGLTGYLGLTVGGTLSVGGISTLYQQGAQIDAVQALQVVTGHGDIVWCSETDNADLFSAALGGLGQVGIITRARLELVPAPTWVGTCVVPYRDADAAFEAMRAAVECGRAHEVFCVILPPSEEAPPTFQVHLAYHQPDSSPQHDDLLAGLPDWTGPAVTNVVRFLEHVRTYDAVIDLWRGGDWDDRLKPWFDVWLGDDTITQFVTQTVSEMTMEDWSLPDGGGFVLLFPHRAEAFGRPRLRLPQDHGLVWLFDVLNVAAPKPDPGYHGRMLARNHRWMTRAESVGGVRYPIGTLHYTPDDWSRHYGSAWDDVVRHKRLYDPAGILTPGPSMFR